MNAKFDSKTIYFMNAKFDSKTVYFMKLLYLEIN